MLHGCCHNPTGANLDAAHWAALTDFVLANNITPFVDIAYQGFGDGIEQDAEAVRLFAQSGLSFFVSSSFSKSFSLYGERVGALSIVTGSKDEGSRVLSQAKRVIRTNYSNPPTHGATVVASVLNSPELRAYRDLGFYGQPNKSINLMMPCVNALVELTEVRARPPNAPALASRS